MTLASFPSLALVRRELIAMLRGTRAWVFLALFVGACMAVAIVMWPLMTLSSTSIAQMASIMFNALCGAMAAGALLLLPGIAALSLVSEREQDTYDQLRLTLITNGGIVKAKFINVLGFYLLLCIGVLPVMGVVFFGVGLDFWQVFLYVCALVFVAAACTAVGLLVGAVISRPMVAVICAYVAVMICTVLGGILVLPMAARLGPSRANDVGMAFLAAYAYCALVTIFSLILAKDCLQPGAEPKQIAQERPIDDPAVLETRRKQFPFYLVDPLRRKDMIDDRQNPMLVKEIRWGFMTRTTIAIRIFYISAIVYGILALVMAWPGLMGNYWSAPQNAMRAIMAQIVLTLALCPALMANTFTKERELGNLDMLRMTLLTPRQIVLGKCVAGALSVAPLLIAATLSAAPLIVMLNNDNNAAVVVLTGYPTLLVCVWVSICMGVYCSLQTRSTTTALILNYVLNVLVFAGGQLCLRAWMILSYAQRMVARQDFKEMDDVLSVLSPITAFMRCAAALTHSDFQWLGYWGLSVVLFTLLGCGLIAMSVASYRHAHSRDR